MDSDQVHAAADLADAATYAGGHRCAGGEESWARALLRRGWDLSLKTAIAGIAATAAPVVAPPIIILSIAGVALSVPFAACLASVAATPPRPYFTYDLGDEESEQEFVDALGAPDQEAPVFGYWSKTEEHAITDNEGFASSPLPRLSEELVPLFANEEGDSADDVFAIQKSGHELFVPRDGKQKDNDTAMDVDNEYITMEAPSPGTVSLPEVPVLSEEDNMVRRMEGAPVPAMESVQELSVSGSENITEDGKSTITVENESSKEMLSPGVDATELSNLGVPMLGNENNTVQRDGEGGVSIRKQGQDFDVSDGGDKTEQHKTTEVTSPHEVDVSESSVQDESTVLIKLQDDLAVEMAPQEEMRHNNPVAGEEVDVQLGVIATAKPERESLQSRHQVSRELQAMSESPYVYDTLGSNLTEGIVKDIDNKRAEGVEHYGGRGVPSTVTMDDDKNLIASRSRLNVSAICDGMTSVGSKPHADHPNQTSSVANKEHGKEELAEDKLDDKVPTTGMTEQDDHIPKSLVPDDQSTRGDEAIVEMVLEEVTSIDPVTGEVVEVQVDIVARESESLPLNNLVAHDLQVVAGAGPVENKTEDIVKAIGDTNVLDVDHQSGGGDSSFVSVTSVLTVDDGEDLMSSRTTSYVSAIDMASVEGRPDLEHRHQTTGVEYKVMDREFKAVVAEGKDIYTEEQLREQLNTLKTITGYRAVPSLTLEGELAGLYVFVGVEPPHRSGGASNLAELNTRLRFLKSIIGVE